MSRMPYDVSSPTSQLFSMFGIFSCGEPLTSCNDSIAVAYIGHNRYMICVLGGTKNPLRSEVARSIVDAILKSSANDQSPARYWSQEEQETRLVKVYEKWVAQGSVWNAAAEKVRHGAKAIHGTLSDADS